MLIHLDIRDLAVVASLNLTFSEGLTVFTGETGAGKSILLTALGLALGDRADPGMIRPGALRAEIHLTFDLTDSPASLAWIREQEFSDEGECIVRRVITVDGRSRAFINNRPVTLQLLQEFGQSLVEIHGQHAHVLLMKAQEQMRLLDVAAGNRTLVERTESCYRKWKHLDTELKLSDARASERSAREDLLRFQIDELERCGADSLDYAALAEEHTRQANSGRILELGHTEWAGLYDDETHSIHARLSRSILAVTEISRLASEFNVVVNLLKDAQVQIKEAAKELRHGLDRQDSDSGSMELLEAKLADAHRLSRKHHVRPEEIPGIYLQLAAELRDLESGTENAENRQNELLQLRNDYQQAADALSERRKQAAKSLESRITAMIRELGLPQGDFQICVQSDNSREPGPSGYDEVEFLVSANPGIPPRSLAKVASGGELSRISLAIQVAATDGKNVPTLIFDEVDSGIGGGIAEVVGQKLRLLGRDRQVFCVTHLPQVAVQGHHHLLVQKNIAEGVTQTAVSTIAGSARVSEIARMLGGRVMTEQTLAHAAEMLELVDANA